MISFDNVSVTFAGGAKGIHALDGLSLEMPAGQMCAVMGPSGSGKSTMIHAASGLITPDAGTVVVDGRSVNELTTTERSILRRRRIGIVFQFFNLLPLLSAYDNVALPLRLDGVPHDEMVKRTNTALASVGLRDRADGKAYHLSGGEMQRVAIARAMAISPAVILADEPTGNLDSANGRQIMDLLGDINSSTGVTTLVVTHDPLWASVCHRVVRLVDGRVSEDFNIAEADTAQTADSGMLDAS